MMRRIEPRWGGGMEAVSRERAPPSSRYSADRDANHYLPKPWSAQHEPQHL